MRSVLFCVAIACMAAGCGNERVVYKPSLPPNGGVQNDPAAKPKWSPPAEKPQIVEKVGKEDLSAFYIPMFPGAKVEKDLTYATKAGDEHVKTIQVTLDAVGSVSEITEWYSKQIKPDNAFIVGSEGGALDGTTPTGYKVRISILKIESKSIIAITVEDTRKK
jgi:hypothetical protein